MFVSRKTFRVEWGDCDPADIVFYPQYLKWFDACTSALFEHAGLPLPALFRAQGMIGIPIVDLKVRFLLPSRFGDELTSQSAVLEWRKSSFVIQHQFFKTDALAVEGEETHVWTARDPDDPRRMKSRPIPPDIIERFRAEV